jgi:hypothetical protein
MKKILFFTALSGSLIACGGNVKSLQCSGLNWNEQGYKNAQSGKSPREFNQYRDSCGDRLEKGAVDAYLDGYTRGIMEFCTYENGYAAGLNSQPLDNVCPVELRASYAKGHSAGAFEGKERKRLFEQSQEEAEAASQRQSVLKNTNESR